MAVGSDLIAMLPAVRLAGVRFRVPQLVSLQFELSLTPRMRGIFVGSPARIAPPLTGFFSEETRSHRRRRAHSKIAGISIDYAGPKFVANFATLQASTRAHSVDRIKRKMFDLKVRRDEDAGLFEPRTHEMIIFTPPRDSPLLNEGHLERLDEALGELTDQSQREGFGFQAMHEVADIGQRVMLGEAIAA